MVEIRYGDYSEQADLAGKSVAEACEQYKLELGIPDKATAWFRVTRQTGSRGGL